MRFKSLLDHMVLKHGQRSNFEKYVNMRNKLILDDIKRRFVNWIIIHAIVVLQELKELIKDAVNV